MLQVQSKVTPEFQARITILHMYRAISITHSQQRVNVTQLYSRDCHTSHTESMSRATIGTFINCVGLRGLIKLSLYKVAACNCRGLNNIRAVMIQKGFIQKLYFFKWSNLLTFPRVCMSFIPSYNIHMHTYNARRCYGESQLGIVLTILHNNIAYS